MAFWCHSALYWWLTYDLGLFRIHFKLPGSYNHRLKYNTLCFVEVSHPEVSRSRWLFVRFPSAELASIFSSSNLWRQAFSAKLVTLAPKPSDVVVVVVVVRPGRRHCCHRCYHGGRPWNRWCCSLCHGCHPHCRCRCIVDVFIVEVAINIVVVAVVVIVRLTRWQPINCCHIASMLTGNLPFLFPSLHHQIN